MINRGYPVQLKEVVLKKKLLLINRDKGYGYAGIMLDHNLQEHTVNETNQGLNGMTVVNTDDTTAVIVEILEFD